MERRDRKKCYIGKGSWEIGLIEWEGLDEKWCMDGAYWIGGFIELLRSALSSRREFRFGINEILALATLVAQ